MEESNEGLRTLAVNRQLKKEKLERKLLDRALGVNSLKLKPKSDNLKASDVNSELEGSESESQSSRSQSSRSQSSRSQSSRSQSSRSQSSSSGLKNRFKMGSLPSTISMKKREGHLDVSDINGVQDDQEGSSRPRRENVEMSSASETSEGLLFESSKTHVSASNIQSELGIGSELTG